MRKAGTRKWSLDGGFNGLLLCLDSFRASTLENFDVSLGKGSCNVSDKVFRIDHLGDFNDLMSVAS